MNRAVTSLAACTLLLGGEIAHAIEAGDYHNSTLVAAGSYSFPYDNRFTGLDHSHVVGPEPFMSTASSISASGAQVFEIYAVVTEGTLFSAVVSMKALPGEKIYKSEEEATLRAKELQQQEVNDSIQYCVRPLA